MSISDGRSRSPIIYGIPGCDTVRRARRWMDQAGYQYHFHDLRRDGLAAEKARDWLSGVGRQALINRRGRTWRELPASSREPGDDQCALALMLAHPTIIRRPVLECAGQVTVGFDPQQWEQLLEG